MSSLGSTNSRVTQDSICEIQQILSKKQYRNKTYYKVKWFGFDDATWEKADNCDCDYLIEQFEKNFMQDEDEDEWDVEQILNKRVRKNKVEYLVKWKDWPGPPTWELAENCVCDNLIAAFENPKLRKLWSFDGSNKSLWLDRRAVLNWMTRYIRRNKHNVNLLRFKEDIPIDEEPFPLRDGLNIGPILYNHHWYLVLILINHIGNTKKILVGDALNTLVGTNKVYHPVLRRLKTVYKNISVKPIAFTQMERSDVCAYYVFAAFERALFLYKPQAHFAVDCIFFDSSRAELIRSKHFPHTNDEISVSLPIPDAFDLGIICEFCKEMFETRLSVDKHILEKHLVILDKNTPIVE